MQKAELQFLEFLGIGKEAAPQETKQEPGASVSGSSPLRPVSVKNFFVHPDTHPIALDITLLDKYGPDWLSWEQETLYMKISQDFQTTGVSELNLHKLQAVKTLHLVDTFWERWEVFIMCCMPFNSIPPDFEVMQVPTVAQCLVAVDTADRIRTDMKWSLEMEEYLGVVYRHEGIWCPQIPLDEIKLDTHDLPIDCEEISRLWSETKNTGKIPETASDVTKEQLHRLLAVNEYLSEYRARLQQQLRDLSHV